MTHCILPTDIELVKKLLAASRPDNAIVAALVHRGIDTASAAQLVTDLRNGRPVAPQIPPGLELSTKRRSRSRRESRRSRPQAAAPSAESTPQSERAAQPRS